MKQHLTRFVAVGLFSTCVSYCIFIIALRVFGVNYLLSSVISFVMTVFFSFLLNKNWTFEYGKAKSRKTVVYYYLVYVTSQLINLAILRVLVGEFGMMPEVASILAIGVAACNNFVGTKFFVFRGVKPSVK